MRKSGKKPRRRPTILSLLKVLPQQRPPLNSLILSPTLKI